MARDFCVHPDTETASMGDFLAFAVAFAVFLDGRAFEQERPAKFVEPGELRTIDAALGLPGVVADELVLCVWHGGGSRAYPLARLAAYRVVNDVIEDMPIAVTWDPKRRSAAVYSRLVDGFVLTFRDAGTDRSGSFDLEDVESGTKWSQPLGTARSGAQLSSRLKLVPVTVTTLGTWARDHPDGRIFVGSPVDPVGGGSLLGLTANEDLFVVAGGSAAMRAFPLAEIARRGLLADAVGDEPVVFIRIGEPPLLACYSRCIGDQTVDLALEPSDRAGAPASLAAPSLVEIGGTRRWSALTGGCFDRRTVAPLRRLPFRTIDRLGLSTNFPDIEQWSEPTNRDAAGPAACATGRRPGSADVVGDRHSAFEPMVAAPGDLLTCAAALATGNARSDDLVVGVEVGDDARAYPIVCVAEMEVLNDVVGGIPLAIAWCSHCQSAVVFERTIDGMVLTFGNARRIDDGTMQMYDVETDSVWSIGTMKASEGPQAGRELVVRSAAVTTLEQWRVERPRSRVLATMRSETRRGSKIRLFVKGGARPRLLVARIGAAVGMWPMESGYGGGLVGDELAGEPIAVVALFSPPLAAIWSRRVGNEIVTLELEPAAGDAPPRLREVGGERRWNALTGRPLDAAVAPPLRAIPFRTMHAEAYEKLFGAAERAGADSHLPADPTADGSDD